MENHLQEIKRAIYQAVLRDVEGINEIGILYSGGLDSSLIALLVKNCAVNADITLYTAGTTDSYDLQNVTHTSEILGMDLKIIEISLEDIPEAVPKLARIIESSHPVKISFELPLFLSLSRLKEKYIISGQGADELFGGYARYLKMDRKRLKEALIFDVNSLIDEDIKMDHRVAEHFNKILRMPYLNEEVVKKAIQIPVEYKVKNGERKIILKKIALELGLPAALVNKEKKAAQYSSGIIKAMRSIAKKEGIGVNELIEHLIDD